MTRPVNWEERKKRLSGSDIAYLMTETDWGPLWEAKRNGTKMPFHATPDAAEFGHAVEPIMAAYLERKVPNISVSLNTAQVTYAGDDPRFCGTPDGFVFAKNAAPFDRALGIFECKTTTETEKWGPSGSKTVNPKAYWQTLFYSHMWDFQRFWIAALVGGVQRWYEFRVDPKDVKRMLDAAGEFMRLVETGVRPLAAPVGKKPVPPEAINTDLLAAAELYARVRDDEKTVSKAKEDAKRELLELLGPYDSFDHERWRVANSFVEKEPAVDAKAVLARLPELLAGHQALLDKLVQIERECMTTGGGYHKLTVTEKKKPKKEGK